MKYDKSIAIFPSLSASLAACADACYSLEGFLSFYRVPSQRKWLEGLSLRQFASALERWEDWNNISRSGRLPDGAGYISLGCGIEFEFRPSLGETVEVTVKVPVTSQSVRGELNFKGFNLPDRSAIRRLRARRALCKEGMGWVGRENANGFNVHRLVYVAPSVWERLSELKLKASRRGDRVARADRPRRGHEVRRQNAS